MANINPNPRRRDPLGVESDPVNITPGSSRAKLPDLPSIPRSPELPRSGSFSLPPLVSPSQKEKATENENFENSDNFVDTENVETSEDSSNEPAISHLPRNPYWDEAEEGSVILTSQEKAEIDALLAIPPLTDQELALIDGMMLAENADTPLATLFALAQNANPMIRERLAISTDRAEVLDLLATDSAADIQLAVLNNVATKDETFVKFAFSTNAVIIMNFTDHPRVTREMLLPMLSRTDINNDEDGFVVRMSLLDSPVLTAIDKQRIKPL